MSFIETKILTYNGLSTDIKPTNGAEDDVLNGSRFREVDTERIYYYNLSDDTWYIDGPPIDSTTHALMTVDYDHHEMHDGNHYFIKTWILNDGGAGTFDEFMFITPNTTKRVHAKVNLTGDADVTFDIYRDATVSANGTPVVPQNNDQDSANTPELLPFAAPTVTTDGTLIWSARNGGGKNPVGVGLGSNYEIIAKTNTIYLFRLTKNTVSDTVIDIDFFWYEHTPKP